MDTTSSTEMQHSLGPIPTCEHSHEAVDEMLLGLMQDFQSQHRGITLSTNCTVTTIDRNNDDVLSWTDRSAHQE